MMYGDLRLSVTGVPTRRQLLKCFNTLFDPLGLVCPVTVEIKLLFQDVCRVKLKLDKCLTPEVPETMGNALFTLGTFEWNSNQSLLLL